MRGAGIAVRSCWKQIETIGHWDALRMRRQYIQHNMVTALGLALFKYYIFPLPHLWWKCSRMWTYWCIYWVICYYKISVRLIIFTINCKRSDSKHSLFFSYTVTLATGRFAPGINSGFGCALLKWQTRWNWCSVNENDVFRWNMNGCVG